MKILQVISAIMFVLLSIVGVIIHIYTVVLSLAAHGMIGAFITVTCPVIAQIFYFFYMAGLTGTFFNEYNIIVGSYAILLGITFAIMLIPGYFEAKKEC